MYSGFRHVTPCEVASKTSTLKSAGLSRLKSAKRCVASLYMDGEGPGRTCREMTDCVFAVFVERSQMKQTNVNPQTTQFFPLQHTVVMVIYLHLKQQPHLLSSFFSPRFLLTH